MSPAFPLAGMVAGLLTGASLIACIFSAKSAVLWLVLLALAGWMALHYQGYTLRLKWSWWLGGLSFTVFYGALTAFWSVAPQDSLKLALRLLGIFSAGLIFTNTLDLLSIRDLEVFRKSVMVSVAVVFALLTVELLTDSKLYSLLAFSEPRITRYNRILTTLSIIVVPVALYFSSERLQKWAGGLLVATTLLCLSQFECDAALVSLVLGLLMLPMGFYVPRRILTWVLALPLVAGTLSAPLLPLYVISPQHMQQIAPNIRDFSYHHRLHIWHFTASRIKEKPLTGWGLDASRQPVFADVRGGWTQPNPDPRPGKPATIEVTNERMLSVHPHNLPLQVWLELGLPGALVLSAMFVLFFLRLEISFPARRDYALALAASVSALFSTMVSFGAWGGAWLASLWIAAAIVLISRRQKPRLIDSPWR